MTDYTKLVEALRRCDMKQGCFNANCRYSVGKYFCDMDKVHKDAADAIEALIADVEKKESRITGLGNRIFALQAEIRESMQRCAECGDELAHQMPKREEVWKDVIGYMEQEGRNMRLIDANALMETIRAHDYPLRAHFNSTDNGMFTLGIQQAVDEQPTVDAVPVTVCAKCKHNGRCMFQSFVIDNGRYYDENTFFCADGEMEVQE